jgi:hypothetical protein
MSFWIGYKLNGEVSSFDSRKRLSRSVQTRSRAQTDFYAVSSYGGSPQIKRPEPNVDHSLKESRINMCGSVSPSLDTSSWRQQRQVYLSSSTFKTLCLYVNCGLKPETPAYFTPQYIYVFLMIPRTNTQYAVKQNDWHVRVRDEDALCLQWTSIWFLNRFSITFRLQSVLNHTVRILIYSRNTVLLYEITAQTWSVLQTWKYSVINLYF